MEMITNYAMKALKILRVIKHRSWRPFSHFTPPPIFTNEKTDAQKDAVIYPKSWS